ncbi:redoxin [Polaribacter sp. SA4-10]|uniref:TlpA family protein disulfide reductase n=1 Tax=Polaribacter sp. SA4-10 TaxID=754397 RepID=UPI000B3D32F3|nr:TlpA disulfide reductase family protein [Polaribacter sp. SA4-10]ARV07876.1 redoxin [Polaribacter sp. SA4-10]
MKNLNIVLFALLVIASCTKEHSKEFLTLSGKLENNKDSLITITGRTGVLKTIKINEDGSFNDTLKVAKGDIYTFETSKAKRIPLYLKNGFDLTLTGNSDEFMTSLKYEGIGSSNSNFIVSQINLSQKIGSTAAIFELEKEGFDKKVASLKSNFDSILFSYKDLDSTLIATANQQNKQMVDYFEMTYAKNLTMKIGKPSPKFEGYIDIKGGKKSLASFKGKFVYIDVWATWCGPCIKEIPSLEKLEKEYHNKNVAFVSISTDESRRSGGSWEAAEKKWRDFVKAKQMTGVQLWAGQDISFQQAYQINAIPRFILIDPLGNIVDTNAPRPSDPRLKDLFSSLGI